MRSFTAWPLVLALGSAVGSSCGFEEHPEWVAGDEAGTGTSATTAASETSISDTQASGDGDSGDGDGDSGDGDGDSGDGDGGIACGNQVVEPGPFCFVNGGNLEGDVTAVTMAQLDSDNHLDILLARDMAPGAIFGNGTGAFAGGTALPTPLGRYTALAAADLDGDGFLDALALEEMTGTVYSFLSDGVQGFGAPFMAMTGMGPAAMAVGPVDSGFTRDFVTANTGSTAASFARGIGDGSFAPTIALGLPATSRDVVMGDFNDDGALDLAFALADEARVLVSFNDGSGSFPFAPASYMVGGLPSALTTLRLGPTPGLDLAVTVENTQEVVVLLNDGTGAFVAHAERPAVGVGPSDIISDDFNGDMRPDLVVANRGSDSLTVLRGVGDGAFAFTNAAPPGLVVGGPVVLAAGDYNEDTVPDLAIGGASGLSIMLSSP